MAIPLIYVFYRASLGGGEVWGRLWSTRIPYLLSNTLILTTVVTAATVTLGVSMAWLVERTDLPGKHVWSWLLAMPLAIPPYVGGLAYITIFGPKGILEEQLTGIWGLEAAARLPDIFGFPGAAAILILFTYPYVYLLTAASLRSFNVSLEDAGRALGYTAWGVFRRVTLPLIRPGVGAGALLVALYVLSDFGAVTLMRFDTFTTAIYHELTARFSRESAAALSAVLVGLTLFVLWGENRLRGKARYYQTTGTWRPPRSHALGRLRLPAIAYLVTIMALSLVLPLALLVYWAIRGLEEQVIGSAFLTYSLNSFGLSATAATIAVVVSVPLAFLAVRHAGPVARNLTRLSQAGYALPGVVVAISIVFIFIRFVPWLYGTVAVLIAAYMIRFLPQSLRGAESGFSQVAPNLEEAARSLGRSPSRAMIEVTVPLVLPGLIAGWALVFLSSLKELPATLLLRPPGFDTLPVRLWADAAEGFYTLAAPAALILVLISAIPVYILFARNRGGLSDAVQS